MRPNCPIVHQVKQNAHANFTVSVYVDQLNLTSLPVTIRLVIGHSDASEDIVYGISGQEFNVTSNGTQHVFPVTGNIVGRMTVLFAFYSTNEVGGFIGRTFTKW